MGDVMTSQIYRPQGNRRVKLLIAAYGIALALSGISQMAYAGDAVGWRFDGNGEFKAPNAPTRWSREEGVAWKSQLPATSVSSPVVAGECAFVTQRSRGLEQLSLFC
jgi:hypothetical protein